jgi:hypothetical protein
MSGFASEPTKVYYFSRHHLFEALAIHLHTPTLCSLVKNIYNLPILRLKLDPKILQNISYFERLEFNYGE